MSHENLSALLDGECSPAEVGRLLDELERNPGLKQAYSRLCQAREAAEGTRILKDQPCICGDVMAGIRNEPMDEAASPKVVDLDSRRRWMPRLQTLGGMAAAATVAAIAVLVAVPGVRQSGDGLSAGGLMPQVSSPAEIPAGFGGTRRSRDLRTVSLTPEEVEQAQQMEELNDLLLEHSSSVADQGVGGTLRYARVAAHAQPAVYRPDDAAGDGR